MQPIALSGDWPLVLSEPSEIAEHIETCASDYDVDVEFAEEYFREEGIAGAILRWVPIGDIRPGDENGNLRCEEKEASYAKLPQETMPPIVLLDGEVQDGNHRYRVALASGTTGMWAYVALDEDELEAAVRSAEEVTGLRNKSRPF